MIDHFPYDKIYEAVLECLKLKKNSVKYVSMLLYKKEDSRKVDAPKEGLQNLFNNVYGKIK